MSTWEAFAKSFYLSIWFSTTTIMCWLQMHLYIYFQPLCVDTPHMYSHWLCSVLNLYNPQPNSQQSLLEVEEWGKTLQRSSTSEIFSILKYNGVHKTPPTCYRIHLFSPTQKLMHFIQSEWPILKIHIHLCLNILAKQ